MTDAQMLRLKNIMNGGIMTGPGNMGQFQPSPVQPSQGVIDPRRQELPQEPANIPAPQAPTPGPQETSVGDMWNQINQIYTPENTQRDRFSQFIDEFPQQKEPSFARRLVASGMGFGQKDPVGTMDKVLDQPYIRDVSAWKEQANPRYQSAQLENTSNANERALAGNLLTATTQMNRTAATERYQNERNEIARIRADTNRAKAEGASVEIDKGSNQVVVTYKVGPRQGQVEYHKIPGGATAEDLANIRGEWNLMAAGARADASMANTVAQGNQVFESSGRKYIINTRTNPPSIQDVTDQLAAGPLTRPGTPGKTGGNTPTKKPLTKSQEDLIRNKILGEYFRNDPNLENVAGGVDAPIRRNYNPRGGTETFTLNPAPTRKKSTWDFNPFTATPEDEGKFNERTGRWAEIDKAIKDAIEEAGGTTPNITAPAEPAAPKVGAEVKPGVSSSPKPPPGRVAVYKDGKLVGHIPDNPEQRALAAKQGYVVR